MARPIAKDYDEKRQLILDRAAQLFASEGFDRASVSRVAKACAISKANIYHYYPSKDEILFDILDKYLRALRDRIVGMDLAGLAPQEQFRQTVVEILLAYQGADNEHRLQASGIKHLPAAQQAILVGYQRDLVWHMSALVAAVAPDVFADNRAKLRAATMSVFGMLNWFYMWNSGADQTAREDYADVVFQISLNGFSGL
ncbi:MAG: TetR/AcrR family transcriptional regulator [Pseudomonadota bacterium]